MNKAPSSSLTYPQHHGCVDRQQQQHSVGLFDQQAPTRTATTDKYNHVFHEPVVTSASSSSSSLRSGSSCGRAGRAVYYINESPSTSFPDITEHLTDSSIADKKALVSITEKQKIHLDAHYQSSARTTTTASSSLSTNKSTVSHGYEETRNHSNTQRRHHRRFSSDTPPNSPIRSRGDSPARCDASKSSNRRRYNNSVKHFSVPSLLLHLSSSNRLQHVSSRELISFHTHARNIMNEATFETEHHHNILAIINNIDK